MSELTYDKLTETEKQIMSLAWNSISGTGLLEQTFIEGLRQIMPPTCTANERKFLDEIREKFHIDEDGDCVFPNEDAWSMIFQKQFTKCNLQELVEKKNNG